VFDATTNTELTPGDYTNVMKLNNTQSWLTFNANKYTTGQKFRIELVANTGGGNTPDPSKNTTLIICCCVVAIILIIILTVFCIKRNSGKRLQVDDENTGDQN
jgi:hypothetical protein